MASRNCLAFLKSWKNFWTLEIHILFRASHNFYPNRSTDLSLAKKHILAQFSKVFGGRDRDQGEHLISKDQQPDFTEQTWPILDNSWTLKSVIMKILTMFLYWNLLWEFLKCYHFSLTTMGLNNLAAKGIYGKLFRPNLAKLTKAEKILMKLAKIRVWLICQTLKQLCPFFVVHID